MAADLGDELDLIEEIAARLRKGLDEYGSMRVDDERDDIEEIEQEIVDALIYTFKLILRRKRWSISSPSRKGATPRLARCCRCFDDISDTDIAKETDAGPLCRTCADGSLAGVRKRIEGYAERRKREALEGREEK